MAHVLARISGVNLDQMKKILKSDAPKHAENGLKLAHLWQNAEDPDETIFLFHAENVSQAKKFIRNVHMHAQNTDSEARLPKMTFLEEK
jgi:hypothetical protein